MDVSRIPGTEAAEALSEIQARRAQVVAGTLVPGWFWAAVGAAMAVFIAAVDSGRPWVTAVGTVVFVVGLGVSLGHVLTRQRAQVHTELLGLRGALAIVGFTVALVGLALCLSFGLAAFGVRSATTIGGLATAVGMVLGGPRLMSYLRTVMITRPIGGRS